MKRKSLGKEKLIAIALAFMTIAGGCGSSKSESYATDSYAPEAYAEEATEAEGGVYETEYEDYEEAATDGSNAAEEVTEEKADKKSNRKLITNMSMTAETKEFDKTVDFLQHRTEELGGYVESFSTSKNTYSDERSAYMTLRVPEDKLSGFINEVSEKSNITAQEKNVTDITLKYADLESHKNALRAEEQQLLALMEKAETIEDIMKVQDKLTEVRYQLESMESQLRTYDNQVSFSTLTVNVLEVIDYTPEPIKNPTFWERARDGFLENCSNVATFFKELLLFIIAHIITILILAAIVVAVIVFVRKSEKKRKERLAKMQKSHKPAVNMAANNASGAFSYGQPAQANNQQPQPQQNAQNSNASAQNNDNGSNNNA